MKNKFYFLIKQSLKKKIDTKWFKVANVILAILLIGILNIDRIVSFFGGDFEEKTTIYVKDSLDLFPSFVASFTESASLLKADNYELKQITEEETLKNDLTAESDYIILELLPDSKEYLKGHIISFEQPNTITEELIRSTLTTLKTNLAIKELALTPEEITALTSSVTLDTTLTNPDAKTTEEKQTASLGLIMILIIPCFFLITLLVQMIGAEINDEKSTRSMEIIISNVSPKIHFLSKIIASNIFVIFQSFLVLGYLVIAMLIRSIINHTSLALASASATNSLTEIIQIFTNQNILNIFLKGLPIILILFLLSFILYAVVSGVLASMTTSIEDFQQLQAPLMIILVLGYYLALMASAFEGSIFIKITAYIPMLSFLIAPTLYMLGQLSLIELLITTSITGAFTWLAFKYGLRIYKVGILNYSSSKLWKKIFKSLREK